MHASIPDPLTGSVRLVVMLAGEAGMASAKTLLLDWARAVGMGFFGMGRVRLTQTSPWPRIVEAEIECDMLPSAALHALHRLLGHFSGTAHGIARATLYMNGSELDLLEDPGATVVEVPGSFPFPVTYPDDLHAAVRVEIEFTHAVSASHRDAIGAALVVWDLLAVALGRDEEWGKQVDHETRMLSPTAIEHEFVGYFAGFEGIDLVVMMALKLHRRVSIERLTIES